MAQYGGHRGKFILGGVVLTNIEGATLNWNVNVAEYGGWGQAHDYAVAVMAGAPTVEIEDPAWDTAQTALSDLAFAQGTGTGTTATGYFYPLGQDVTTVYAYGSWAINEWALAVLKGDVIRQPFGLIAAGAITRVGF